MAATKSESEFAGDNEATASSTTLVKRRKRKEEELEGDHEESRIISNGGGETSAFVFRCLRRPDSPEGENYDDGLLSYCSGNGFVDLVEDNKMAEIQRRKIIESKKKRRVMVKEAEVEDFFAATNKDLLNQFSKKYNFDFEKEEALDGGRYEWVKSKPW